jgi:hypothetical protein
VTYILYGWMTAGQMCSCCLQAVLPVWVVFLEHVTHCIVLLDHQVVQQLDATPEVQVETDQLNSWPGSGAHTAQQQLLSVSLVAQLSNTPETTSHQLTSIKG